MKLVEYFLFRFQILLGQLVLTMNLWVYIIYLSLAIYKDIMSVVEEEVEELAIKEGSLPFASNIIDRREDPCFLLLSSMMFSNCADWIAERRTVGVLNFCENLGRWILFNKRTSHVLMLFSDFKGLESAIWTILGQVFEPTGFAKTE